MKIINYKIKDLAKNKSRKWVYILQELCQQNIKQEIETRTSLTEKNKKYYSQQEIVNIFYPLIILLAELQKYGLAHRSIKLQNILRGFDNEIKISDFGTSQALMRHYALNQGQDSQRDIR